MFNSNIIRHELGIFARRICTAVFLNQIPFAYACKNYSTPSKELFKMLDIRLDEKAKVVTVLWEKNSSAAKFCGSQGSVLLPQNVSDVLFSPVQVVSALGDASQQDWPMGDRIVGMDMIPSGLCDRIQDVVKKEFEGDNNLHAAFVVLYKGQIVGEVYDEDHGISKHTQLESWSMGKSLLATLFARLVSDGTFHWDDFVDIPEWSEKNDLRGQIRFRDLLQMSSGLKFSTPFDTRYTEYDYTDHGLGYSDPIDVYQFSRLAKLDAPEYRNKGIYKNCDPWILASLIKDAVVKRGQEYLKFPQEDLFDRIGIREQTLETDSYGNYLFTGCVYGTARNWARLGLLYLQNGIWLGQQILPEGWVSFVRTPGSCWEKPEYGGLFWLNNCSEYPLPESTYYAAGIGDQFTFIIPEYDMVVVRMGYVGPIGAYKNSSADAQNPNLKARASTLRILRKLSDIIKSLR